MGQGFGFGAMAPIRIATERTRLAMPEAKIGLFNDVGGTYFLSRHVPPEVGLYFGLTSREVRGKDCLDWGFATHYC